MITAEPSHLHRRLLSFYFRRRGKRLLSEIRVKGLEKMIAWNRGGGATHPLIIIANHSSWWDAVLPILISLDHHSHDAYGLMEERQLRRYTFFRRLGMFSIDREDPRSAMTSLEYAAELLRGTNRVLWLFPQGELVPNDKRPLVLYNGTSHLLTKLEEATLLPVAFRYELLRTERPQAFCLIGEPLPVHSQSIRGSKELHEELTRQLTQVVDTLRENCMDEDYEGYEIMLRGRGSIDSQWDQVRGIKRVDR